MSALLLSAVIVAAAGVVADYSGRIRRWIHVFQLEHYEGSRLLRWTRRRHDLLHPLPLAGNLTALAGASIAIATGARGAAVALVITVAIVSIGTASREWTRPEKKPFVLTDRAKRLFALSLLPALLFVSATAVLATVRMSSAIAVGALLGVGLAIVAAAPILILAANVALTPVQRRINGRYVSEARAKLESVAPLTVGITGSYGKTTTKFCVGAVLSTLGETLVTPESYNSLLGITRTVNEHLNSRHLVFVVEMGAYRRGDISELCQFAQPTIGILTAIGPMHLERFGSLEAIKSAKAELLQALPTDGHFITNADDPACRSIAASSRVPVTLFGIDASDAQVRASDICMASGKTSFTLHLGQRTHPVESQLLGRHNVRNLLAAAACGAVAHVADRQIVDALESIQPPPHRLAPIVNRQTGVTVIDDAYNSNPEGAAGALEVLAEHAARRRVLVTPGMVELGEYEEKANLEYGRIAANVCDLVILVGVDQTMPIRRGLLEGGFDSRHIVITRDIEQATVELRKVVRAGDVVLFENDLPDTYSYATNGRLSRELAPSASVDV